MCIYIYIKENRDKMLAFELATKERDLPGTTPLVAMALMEIAVSSVCNGKKAL